MSSRLFSNTWRVKRRLSESRLPSGISCWLSYSVRYQCELPQALRTPAMPVSVNSRKPVLYTKPSALLR